MRNPTLGREALGISQENGLLVTQFKGLLVVSELNHTNMFKTFAQLPSFYLENPQKTAFDRGSDKSGDFLPQSIHKNVVYRSTVNRSKGQSSKTVI